MLSISAWISNTLKAIVTIKWWTLAISGTVALNTTLFSTNDLTQSNETEFKQRKKKNGNKIQLYLWKQGRQTLILLQLSFVLLLISNSATGTSGKPSTGHVDFYEDKMVGVFCWGFMYSLGQWNWVADVTESQFDRAWSQKNAAQTPSDCGVGPEKELFPSL